MLPEFHVLGGVEYVEGGSILGFDMCFLGDPCHIYRKNNTIVFKVFLCVGVGGATLDILPTRWVLLELLTLIPALLNLLPLVLIILLSPTAPLYIST